MTDVLPHNLDAEQAVLGAVILDNALFDMAGEHLAASDFHEPVHGLIWTWAAERIRAGAIADGIAMRAAFESEPAMTALGGVGYIADLVDASCAPAVLIDYARLIRDLAKRRALIVAGQSLVAAARTEHDAGRTAETIVAAHEATLAEIALTGGATGAMPVGMLTARRLKDLRAPVTETIRIATGIADLDDAIVSLEPGDLWVLGARPGMGKTAVALTVAANVAARGYGVAFYSMDMSANGIADRLLAMHCEGQRIEYRDIARRRAVEDWGHVLDRAADHIATLPIVVDDKRSRTPDDLISAMRRHRIAFERKGVRLGLVVLDHLQRVASARKRDSDYAEKTDTMRRMKDIAGALGAPLLLCSQLSRGVEARDDKRPKMSDLRDTGAIEEEADLITLLFREAYYVQAERPPEDQVEKMETWRNKMAKVRNRLELINAKVRQGTAGMVEVYCDIATNKIRSLSHHQGALADDAKPF